MEINALFVRFKIDSEFRAPNNIAVGITDSMMYRGRKSFIIRLEINKKGPKEPTLPGQIDSVQRLASRWEHTLQRDDEGQTEKRRHIVVRLITSGDRSTERVHLHVCLRA